MKTTKKFVNYVFAMLFTVILFGCSSENSMFEGIEPEKPAEKNYTYKLLKDGLVDSSYVKMNSATTTFYTQGFIASQYNKVEKKSGDVVGGTQTFLTPYKNVQTLSVSGAGVEVASKALEVSFVAGATSESHKSQGDTCYIYEMKKNYTLSIKTLSEKDAVISCVSVNQRFEDFLDGKDNRVTEIPYVDVKEFGYTKYALDSLKSISAEKDRAYYSFYFNSVREAKFFAPSRYEWGNKMKTRASVDGEEVEISSGVYYNYADALTETLKITVELIVPADGKEPNETGVTYENEKLVKKDNDFYTSSKDKYKNYDNGTKVLEKNYEYLINVFADLDTDPSIIDLGKSSITSVGTPTFKETAAAKTNKTIGEYYVENQKKSWAWTWPYGTGSLKRTVSTIEEYPYIIDGAKKEKMLSSTWKVTLKSSTMDAGVDYTHNAKKGRLHTQINVFEAEYYGEIRTFTGKNKFFVEATEEAKQTGWEILEKGLKKKNDTYYNTFGNLFKVFDTAPKELDKAIDKDFEVSAVADNDGDIIVISDKSKIGSASFKEVVVSKNNLTEGSFLTKKLSRNWVLTWPSGLTRKLTTVEGEVFYMAGSTQLEMETSTWTVSQKVTVDAGKAYTHNSKKGTLYTETIVWEATYYGEKRAFTKYNKYFVSEPDPAVEEVTSFTKGHTTQSSQVDGWIKFVITKKYNGETTAKDSISADVFTFNFEAAADKNFKKTQSGLNILSSNVSKSTSATGTKTKNNNNLNAVLSFGDGTTTNLTFPGFFTTGYVNVRGKNYDYELPVMTISAPSIEQVGGETTIEEGGKVYKRLTYKVTATATIDTKSITRSTTITVDTEVVQRINPEKGAFKYTYETYAPSLDNKLHRVIVFAWEKKIDMIVDGVYQETVNNPDASKVYQSVYCLGRNASESKPWNWTPASITTPVTGWWRYTSNDGAVINWSWQINGSFEGVTLKEGDWNQAGHTNVVRSIDSDGYTVLTAYNADGTKIYSSK